MSYIYLQEQGAESSAECFSDISQFVQSKLNHILGQSCCNDSETEYSLGSLSGTMCEPLTANPGEELQKSSAAGSLARTLVAPVQAQGLTVQGLDSGEKWQGSFVKYSPAESLWKTHQCSLFGDWDEFSETWPKWGSMHDGECWERIPPVQVSCGNGCGLWPSAVATDYKGSRTPEALAAAGRNERNNLRDFLRAKGGWLYPPAKVAESLMMWPEGWTDSEQLAMDKFQQWQHSHGRF